MNPVPARGIGSAAPDLLNRRTFLYGAAAVATLGVGSLEAGTGQPSPTPFGPASTAEEVTRDIDLTGKLALVTGCNSGLGYETMRVLALRGAHVLGTARTIDKASEACRSVKGSATPLELELTQFDTIVACADRVASMDASIDILVCNAGVVVPRLEQVRGLEKHFVVNHLGHFILVNRLLERVTAARQGRVVVVSSSAHRNASRGIEFDNLAGDRDFDRARMYGHSKLANALFSRELARRLRGTAATSNSLCPGGVKTQIFRELPERQAILTKTPAQGASTICYLATAPGLVRVSGEFFRDCAPAHDTGFIQDDAMAARLWEVSAVLARDYLA